MKMKPILFLVFYLTALAAGAIHLQRRVRDVAEIATSNTAQVYLPPNDQPAVTDATSHNDEVKVEGNAVELARNSDIEADKKAVDAPIQSDSAVLGVNGYEYKTVRRLRMRARRDVSHLNRDYLPPVVKLPATHYLPPIEHPSKPPKITNEYLPPHIEVETEAPTTEAPTTTTTPITTTTEIITEEPTTEAPMTKELVDDTAILAEDGYHYKKPDVIPDLSPVREYLPPLEEGVVIAEGPANDETSILADDGYHFRAIRRLKF